MIASDLELLITAFEHRTEPLSKGVVKAKDVGDYLRRKGIATSNDRIGRLLNGPPFNGVSRKIAVDGEQFRCIIFDNRWLSAPARETLAYMCDPLLD